MENVKNVELKRGDLAALPLDDACVDAAVLMLALTYVADADIVIREMHRSLKPGGRAVIVDLLPHRPQKTSPARWGKRDWVLIRKNWTRF